MDGQSSLSGINVGDVVGWAPTADVLSISTNQCTGDNFSGFTLVENNETSASENDAALKQLLDGDVDALWICKYLTNHHGLATVRLSPLSNLYNFSIIYRCRSGSKLQICL